MLGSLALIVALILYHYIFVALKSILSDARIATPAFYLFIYLFLLSISLVNLSPSLCFESLCIHACEMGLDVAYCWVLAVSFDWGI